MPWVTINIMEGRTEAQKRALHEKVAAAVADTLSIPADRVRIQIVDMAPCDHSIGGVTIDRLSA